MLFKSFRPKTKERWEYDSKSPVPKDQYTYVVGLGFIPYDAKKEEERYIKRRSNYLSLCAFVLFLIKTSMSILRPFLFDVLNINVSFFNESIYGIISLIIGISFSGILYVTLIDMPFKKMFPIGTIDLGVTFAGVGIYLFVSVIGDVITKALYFLSSYININLSKGPSRVLPETLLQSVVHLILVYIIPLVIEEVFFQGIILQSLRPIGDGFAIITTTILITIITSDFYNFFPIFFTALVLSYFTIKTNNIILPVIIRVFGSVIWGWQDLMVSVTTEKMKPIVTSVILMFFLLIGSVAIWFILYKKEDMLVLEDIESSINFKENINRFFTNIPFIVMSIIMFVSMIWRENANFRY